MLHTVWISISLPLKIIFRLAKQTWFQNLNYGFGTTICESFPGVYSKHSMARHYLKCQFVGKKFSNTYLCRKYQGANGTRLPIFWNARITISPKPSLSGSHKGPGKKALLRRLWGGKIHGSVLGTIEGGGRKPSEVAKNCSGPTPLIKSYKTFKLHIIINNMYNVTFGCRYL